MLGSLSGFQQTDLKLLLKASSKRRDSASFPTQLVKVWDVHQVSQKQRRLHRKICENVRGPVRKISDAFNFWVPHEIRWFFATESIASFLVDPIKGYLIQKHKWTIHGNHLYFQKYIASPGPRPYHAMPYHISRNRLSSMVCLQSWRISVFGFFCDQTQQTRGKLHCKTASPHGKKGITILDPRYICIYLYLYLYLRIYIYIGIGDSCIIYIYTTCIYVYARPLAAQLPCPAWEASRHSAVARRPVRAFLGMNLDFDLGFFRDLTMKNGDFHGI